MSYIDTLREELSKCNVTLYVGEDNVLPGKLPEGHYVINIINNNVKEFNPSVNKRYYVELYPDFVTDLDFHNSYNYGQIPSTEMAGTVTTVSKDYVYGVFSCVNGCRWYGWIPKICVKDFKEL